MKGSLFFRLFAGYVFIVFALTGLTLLVLWPPIENHYMSTLTNTLKNSALMAEPAVLPLLDANRQENLNNLVQTLGKETQTRITVIDASGRVLADSEQDARFMENHKNRPEFAQALEGNVGSTRRYSSTASQDMLYVAVPLQQPNKQIVGVLRTSFFLRSINSLLADLRQKMVRITLLVLLFALAGAALLSRTVSKPIRQLTQAVRKVSSGDFSVRLFPRAGGEIRELADSFNAMSDRIDEMVLELKRQKEELHSIIASLQEGLVVLDSEGKIIMVNESFRKIAYTRREGEAGAPAEKRVGALLSEGATRASDNRSIGLANAREREGEAQTALLSEGATRASDNRSIGLANAREREGEAQTALLSEGATRAPIIVGRSYWHVVRNAGFIELIQKVQEEKTGFTEELQLNDRVFVCSAAYLPVREETVAVFHDITEIRDMERLKRDFVVNVSHELRTPLTAIKGFTETLEEEASPDAKHYLEIIRRNTDRLINIISDLLLLSQLEEKGMKLELEAVDLRDLMENVVRVFEQSVREKGLQLSVNVDKSLPLINADPFKLEQLLINLLDNAVKYTEAGEVGIRAYAGDSRMIVIEVQDTGIGIPSEDIPRIFERFYVVDKSRSKKVGGTGLGLSIVKHIVLFHNGAIDVNSTLGKGTTVTIRLPIYPSPKTSVNPA